MKTKFSRRDFLRSSALSLASVSAYSLGLSSSALAQSSNKNGPRAVVAVQLLGGADPWLALPPTSDAAIIRQLRGDYARINPSGLIELAPGLGVHPGLALLEPYFGSLNAVMQTAPAMHLNPSRSHDIAQLRMLTGGFGDVNSRIGWTARVYDTGVELRGFGGHSASFNCQSCSLPPVVTPSYEAFDTSAASFPWDPELGGAANAKHVTQTLKKLVEVKPSRPVSPVEQRYRNSQKAMFNAVDTYAETLTYQTPLHDAYQIAPDGLPEASTGGYIGFAKRFRNIAQTLLELKSKGDSRTMLFVLSLGGFDLHDSWLVKGNELMWQLGGAIKTFRDDLGQMNLDNNVVTFCSSEFGRTIAGNGKGSDHGIGGIMLLTGGRIRGGVSGEIIPARDLLPIADPKLSNAWPRQISQERVIVNILEQHLGIDGRAAYPDPYYSNIPTHGELGFF